MKSIWTAIAITALAIALVPLVRLSSESSERGLLHTLRGHRKPVIKAAFSPDGETLISGSQDGSIKVWDVESGQLLRSMRPAGHVGLIRDVAFSPDEETVAAAYFDRTDQDNSVRLWRVSNGKLLRRINVEKYDGYETRTVDFSPDGKTLVTAYEKGAYQIRRVADGSLVSEVQDYHIYGAYFSPDGKKIVTDPPAGGVGSEANIQIWRVKDGRRLLKIGVEGNVSWVDFGPDGDTIIAGIHGLGEFIIFDADDGRELRSVRAHKRLNDVVFSPDGETIASAGGDYTFKLWRASDLKLLNSIRTHTRTRRDISLTSVVFSPDGKLLATTSWDRTINLWRVSDVLAGPADQSHVKGACALEEVGVIACSHQTRDECKEEAQALGGKWYFTPGTCQEQGYRARCDTDVWAKSKRICKHLYQNM